MFRGISGRGGLGTWNLPIIYHPYRVLPSRFGGLHYGLSPGIGPCLWPLDFCTQFRRPLMTRWNVLSSLTFRGRPLIEFGFGRRR